MLPTQYSLSSNRILCGLFILLISFVFLSCTSIFISDTILPDEVKIVSEDYELYDGRPVIFFVEDGSWPAKLPSSLSGRKVYQYEELSRLSGIVEGEYEIDHGRYFVIRLADNTLVKVHSEIFLEVTNFTDK